jgi:hypothetical protein
MDHERAPRGLRGPAISQVILRFPWAIPYSPRPTLDAMNEPPRERPQKAALRRDQHVRSVSRTTKTVAAVAVIGTAAFGGLAATGITSAPTTASRAATSAAASDGAATPAQSSAPTYDQTYQGGSDDGWSDDGWSGSDDGTVVPVAPSQDFQAPQSAPGFSQQGPVASSGGS